MRPRNPPRNTTLSVPEHKYIEDDSISCKNHCICPPGTQRKCTIRRSVPGSNAFVPSVAGLIIGGEVVKDLVGFVPMKG